MNKKKKQVSKSEKTKKKIGFFSAVMLVIGSSIGAGIFLKNGEILGNTGNSVILTLVSWVISIFGVICMGVSLAEIGSADTKSNLGIISWVKNFCHKYLYKVSKYFMAFLYLPLNFFLMPYYVVLQFQDAFGWQTQWWVAALIAFAITVWFFIASGLSSKLGNAQNWVITCVKFIPLAFCVIAGITLACTGNCQIGKSGGPSILPEVQTGIQHRLLAKMYPALGIIGSIPAIIFSFDGFYSAAGIQSEMAEPKKTPAALVVGLLIVSIIDVLISVGLLIGTSDGRVNTLAWFNEHGFHWVIGVVNILIAFGILGIINGFAMYNPRYYEDLIKLNELPFSNKLKDKINPNKPIVGLIYAGVITLVFFIAFTFIGAYGYSDVIGYSGTKMTNMSGGIASTLGYSIGNSGDLNTLYSFCDLMANWTSLIAFLCIVFAIVGAMINRKKKTIAVTKVKGFWMCSIVSTIVISVAMAFIIASTIGNIFIVWGWRGDIGLNIGSVLEPNIYTQKAWNVDFLGVIMTAVMLVVFALVCCIPSSIEMHREKHLKVNKRVISRA